MSKQPLNEHQRSEGITAISVEGYKSLAEACEVAIRPLTPLAGANSSGKSSLMQPLLLLKQTLEATYDPGPLLLNGPNVRLTSTDQLLSKITGHKAIESFKVMTKIDNSYWVENLFTRREYSQTFDLSEMKYGENQEAYKLYNGMRHDEILSSVPQHLVEILIKFSDNRDGSEFLIERNRCFYNVLLAKENRNIELKNTRGLVDYSLALSFSVSDIVSQSVRRVIHVPGLRGNPERTYQTSAVGNEFPGTFDNYVASVIKHWQSTKDERIIQLNNDLERLGLTWKVTAQQIDATQVELRVARLRRSGLPEDTVSIADVGFGVSQTLPVLVAVLAAEPGQLVYLEQPELHLHPRAQVALAEVLVAAANRGVRVVAETHSNLLILAVQTLVAEGKIVPDDVKLHWFARDEDGVTKITSADLDENGAFGDWPEDFADVTLAAEDKYLTAVETRQAAE